MRSEPLPKRFVLLVEDDLPVAEMALLLIERLGVEVVHASDGPEGLRLAQQRIPNAIVTDVDLPGLNGLELCERLKADALTAGIPVLVWSGNPRHRNVAMAVGASEFLTKPQEVARLSECVRRMLGL